MSELGTTVDSVMQAFEDALVAELVRVFGVDMPIYTSKLEGQIPEECVMAFIKVTNMKRPFTDIRSRTIMIDFAVITNRGDYWAQDKLMEISEIDIGGVKKVIPSGRFSSVEGVVHLSTYMLLTEIANTN